LPTRHCSTHFGAGVDSTYKMTPEQLSISNFAGLKKIDLPITPITVIIGPQSVGKSVSAKVLYYFKSALWDVFESAYQEPDRASMRAHLVEKFVRLLPQPALDSGPSKLTWCVGDHQLSLQHSGSAQHRWSVSLPDFVEEEFERLVKRLSKAIANDPSGERSSSLMFKWHERSKWRALLRKHLGPNGAALPRFIPAGRSFYSQIERDAASFFETAAVDPFVADFGKYLARLKSIPLFRRGREPASGAKGRALVEQLVSGKYYREAGRDYIRVRDGRRLPASLWSSGQQEVLPLAYLLQRYCEAYLRADSGVELFVEEPEAHLFPASQRVMIELLALAFNTGKGGLGVFLTTHSPYVLTTLNNLLQAGQLYTKRLAAAKKAAVAKTLPPDRALAPRQLGAFHMDQNGCKSIMDEETGLIDARAIDDVSGAIAVQFDTLLDLDLSLARK
jgi:hypothetical protein